MYKHFLYKHCKKNLQKFIISNFIFLKKKYYKENKIKFYFFYNYFNFYLSIYILFNFWILKIKFFLKKDKILISNNNFDFFSIFSLFFYPNLYNLKKIYYSKYTFLYFTFFINSFFFNPFYILLSKIYRFQFTRTFNLLKIAVFLKKKQFFFLTFYMNFFQIPLFFKNEFEIY